MPPPEPEPLVSGYPLNGGCPRNAPMQLPLRDVVYWSVQEGVVVQQPLIEASGFGSIQPFIPQGPPEGS